MKPLLVILVVIWNVEYIRSEQMMLDARLEHCLWNTSKANGPYEAYFRNQIKDEYARLQIVTGLTRYHLSVFGNYHITPTNNPSYNAFLICSWHTYGYLHGTEIIYDSIEMALKEALIRAVGASGPGTQLSKLQARNIVRQCRDVSQQYIATRIIHVQNCIHRNIGYLKSL
ncbi:hypothetical protein PPYR_01953 [Photinus pyralis]|uniref:Uncharacterized protein n=1 Tax=Photinus pyralis TaxID=7054 RepID=A0A1Y1K8I0_PHOPY|nr:hypothetical protein PPYR_01953 [Photinus pyralis]